MPVPAFGFSVGDFVATGQLATRVINNLRSSKPEAQSDSAVQFLEQVRQIFKDLEGLDGSVDTDTVNALLKGARACTSHLEELDRKANKFHSSFTGQNTNPQDTRSKIKQAYKKIIWTVSANDVEEMKRTIGNHVISMIGILQIQQCKTQKQVLRDQGATLDLTEDILAMLLSLSQKPPQVSCSVQRVDDTSHATNNGQHFSQRSFDQSTTADVVDVQSLQEGLESLLLSLW